MKEQLAIGYAHTSCQLFGFRVNIIWDGRLYSHLFTTDWN